MSFITSAGFAKKTLQEIKAELETSLRAIFGSEIDLDPDQPLGQWVGLMAKRDAELWDLVEEIYNARNPNKATGISLDFITAENGINRIPARATTVQDVVLYGDDGAVVPAGSRIKGPTSALNYLLDSAITIQKELAVYADIEVDSFTIGATYTVTINGTDYDYIGVTDKETTTTAIFDGLVAALAGYTVVRIDDTIQISHTVAFTCAVSSNMVINEVGSVGNFTAASTGANPCEANTLTVIVTSRTGWNSVNNPNSGITGRVVESDSELRIRRVANVGAIGAGTEESIRSAILNEVSGVNGATIYSNRTANTDGDGRPPHSFEVIVSGGADAAIAEKIWQKQPAGIVSYGNETEFITDSQGFIQTIKFSRPETLYIHVRVSRALFDEEIYPADGDVQIKNAIAAWSLDTDNIDVGKDIIRQRLSIPIYSVPGIEDILIELDATANPGDIPAYAEQNIVCDIRQIANFAVDRITVQELV